MVHDVGVRVCEGSNDTLVGVVTGLRGVLGGVGPEKLQHDVAGVLPGGSTSSSVIATRLEAVFSQGWKVTNAIKKVHPQRSRESAGHAIDNVIVNVIVNAIVNVIVNVIVKNITRNAL